MYSLLCPWVATSVILGGCPAPAPMAPKPVVARAPMAVTTAPSPAGRPTVTFDPVATEGEVTIQLASATARSNDVAVTTLSSAETSTLLARLEPLPAIDNSHAPVLRAPSTPPAPSGTIEPIAFVRPIGNTVDDRPIAPASALPSSLAPPEILPTGELGRGESELNVRFDEPMIAVSTLGAVKIPFAISPPIAGTWRWLDTRVASFTATDARIAQATDYTITVPAGTRALSGATLATAVTGRFSTPPVGIRSFFPARAIRPDAPIALELDQDVDPDAVAKLVRVETDHHKALPFKLISKDDAVALWSRNPNVELVTPWFAHAVIVAPISAWPAGTNVHVALAKGVPSREGPRVTTREDGIEVHVVPPFTVTSLDCDGVPRLTHLVCPARSSIRMGFSNAIDRVSYHPEKIQIDGLKSLADHHSYGSFVDLQVPDRVGAKLGITITGELDDAYGQPLTGPRHFAFTTTRQQIDPMLVAPSGLYVLDPRFEIPQWQITTEAVPSLHVQLYAVQPADYFAYQAFEAHKRSTPPGTRMFDKTFTVGERFSGNARSICARRSARRAPAT